MIAFNRLNFLDEVKVKFKLIQECRVWSIPWKYQTV